MQFFESCESTQKLAVAWARNQQSPSSEIFRTNNQTAGLGRTGPWSDGSPDGMSLMMSFALVADLPTNTLLNAPRNAAQIVTQELVVLGVTDVDYSPPNDLVVGALKVGGILIDSATVGDTLKWIVYGIGVNLTGPEFAVGGVRATTIEAASGNVLAADTLAEKIGHSIYRSLTPVE